MRRIAYIQHPTERTVVLGLRGEDDAVCRLSVGASLYAQLGSPARGASLDDETVTELRREDERRRALTRAMHILAHADNSERMLYQKLRAKGFSAEASTYAASYAVREGLLDERRQLRARIPELASRRFLGPHRIPRHLATKGYDARLVREVMAELRAAGEIDVEESFRRLCEKHGATDAEARRRLAYTYGYGPVADAD